MQDKAQQFGIFSFRSQNIGDDMQALSMLLHLRRVSEFLDRDQLDAYRGDALNFVTTAAFPPGQRPPSKARLLPLFWGMCVGSIYDGDKDWIDYFKKNEPFGARDMASAEIMRGLGIEAYWSGCITLFLGRKLQPIPQSERSGIVFVDVTPDEESRFVPSSISQNAYRISNFVPASIVNDPLARFAYLARNIDIIRRAKLVVTRRVHVALPCIGLRTPVIAIPPARIVFPRHRFSGYDAFLPVRYSDEMGGNDVAFDWDNPVPTEIPSELERSYERFCKYLDERQALSRTVIANDSPYWPGATNAHYRIDNPGAIVAPGRIKFVLGDTDFEMRVHFWTAREIIVDLQAFPGFDRLPLKVRVQQVGKQGWNTIGTLASLNGAFLP